MSWVRPGSVEMTWSKVAKVRSGSANRSGRALDDGEAAAAAVVHQMTADVKKRVVVAEIGDDMAIPDLVEQGLSRHAFPSAAVVVARTDTPSSFEGGDNAVRRKGKTAARLERGTIRGVSAFIGLRARRRGPKHERHGDGVTGGPIGAGWSSLTVMVSTESGFACAKHHRGMTMKHYAGIDVSLEGSSVCVVDEGGRSCARQGCQ